MKYINHNGSSMEGYAVQIQARGKLWWIDVDIYEKDVRTDWNQYIFHLDNEDDLVRRKMQDDVNFFMEITEFATGMLVSLGKIRQNNLGEWEYI